MFWGKEDNQGGAESKNRQKRENQHTIHRQEKVADDQDKATKIETTKIRNKTDMTATVAQKRFICGPHSKQNTPIREDCRY